MPYSNYIDGEGIPWIEAFGGDDPSNPSGTGMFQEQRSLCGTSYSAPLVSALVYLLRTRNLQLNDLRHRLADYL